MSYGYNNGGCGCGGTVQFAPPACNPNFPTYCSALGQGSIQRVVGEDSAYCKYTVPTLASNSILTYNASTGIVNWADGSASNPIYLGSVALNESLSNTALIQGLTPTGQLVGFTPSGYSSETRFPIVASGQSNATWGTIESVIPNQGLVYKNNSGSVAQLTSAQGNIVTFDANGNPIAASASSIAGATAVPSGAVLPFAYNVTSGIVPTGWLLCDGSIYNVSAYPTLGALLANTYGGSTGTFAVPNLSGLFIRGSGTQTSGGITYASGSLGSIQADEFQGHYHSASTNASHYQATGSSAGSGSNNLFSATVTVTSPTTDGTNGTPRTGTETRPVNLAMVYCIKT